VYILLRSLLRCLMMDSSYEDTSMFIFRVLGIRGLQNLSIKLSISRPPGSTSLKWEPDLTLIVCYLSTLVCATYCHVCLSHGERGVPVPLDGYTNMYPLLK